MSGIDKIFAELRSKKEKALIPYIMAGDPRLERTKEMVLAMEKAGADMIELGVPFSDPIADGPVIQRAGQRSLKCKTSLKDILSLVADLRKKTNIPLILMTYYNPVLKLGVENLFKAAERAGVDGLIIPDLPPEEGRAVLEESRRCGLNWILLSAPTTPVNRLKFLAKQTQGFLYYVSLTGITGSSLKDLSEVRTRLSMIRRMTDKPVAIGFGISTPEQAKALGEMADGVIVGSAIVRLIEQHLEDPELPFVVSAFVKRLKQAMTGRSF
ncbi:MAG TPA: tryptophan synthase subunit alpha [Nitrospiria bacterium]|nr:tryptophan synthase subunit alpha [Nitrospiria bacterium]HUK55609.1 tryptophan synthase subunit alpha [Nitrospiria bacterium]